MNCFACLPLHFIDFSMNKKYCLYLCLIVVFSLTHIYYISDYLEFKAIFPVFLKPKHCCEIVLWNAQVSICWQNRFKVRCLFGFNKVFSYLLNIYKASPCMDWRWCSNGDFGWAQTNTAISMFAFKVSRGTSAPACQDSNFLISQLQVGMFVVETKVNSLLTPYWLTFTTYTFWKCCWSCFTGKIYSYCSDTARSPKNLLKKRAPRWFQPDNKLCSVTPLTVTSISYQYKTGQTKAFVEPVEFQSKGHSHTLL